MNIKRENEILKIQLENMKSKPNLSSSLQQENFRNKNLFYSEEKLNQYQEQTRAMNLLIKKHVEGLSKITIEELNDRPEELSENLDVSGISHTAKKNNFIEESKQFYKELPSDMMRLKMIKERENEIVDEKEIFEENDGFDEEIPEEKKENFSSESEKDLNLESLDIKNVINTEDVNAQVIQLPRTSIVKMISRGLITKFGRRAVPFYPEESNESGIIIYNIEFNMKENLIANDLSNSVVGGNKWFQALKGECENDYPSKISDLISNHSAKKSSKILPINENVQTAKNKLFEEFLILGESLSVVDAFDLKEEYLEPKILYQYPGLSENW